VLRFAEESFYVRAPSQVICQVPRGQTSFSVVGYCPLSYDVQFIIHSDRGQIATTQHCRYHEFKVDLPRGTTRIHLEVDALGRPGGGEAFWCYPRFHQKPAAAIPSFDAKERCVPLAERRDLLLGAPAGKNQFLINQSPEKHLRPLHPESIKPCDEYLYAHADSRIEYAIPLGVKRFSAIAYALASTSVGFRVFVNGQQFAKADRPGIESVGVALPPSCRSLVLETLTLGNGNFDHAFWCYPRFWRDPQSLAGKAPALVPPTATVTSGAKPATDQRKLWKYWEGAITQQNDGTWLESKTNGGRWEFNETGRTPDYVELTSKTQDYGFRLFARHAEIRHGAAAYGHFAPGEWNDSHGVPLE
jgi:hypothetical protein